MDCGLILQGDKNINPGARLNLAYAGVVMFESPRPIIGSLDGCGQIFLGVQNAAAEVHDGYHLPAVAGHDTTLVLGADNTDAAFYGTIRQAGDRTGDGIGSLVKTGKGVFTLYGGHTYTGPTTVEQGTLDLRGGLAGGVLVKPEGTLKGTGRIADGLRLEGTLTVDACGPTGQPLQVAGAAKLRGSLQVTTPHDSAPAASRKWTVLAAQGGITGHVDQVTKGYQASIAADGKRLEVERLAR
jgi:autotransporter-associated beta strand protein